MAEVLINLGTDSYAIHIEPGILDSLERFLGQMPFTKKALIVTDDNVQKIYGEKVFKKLTSAGYDAEFFCVRPGENSKSFAVAQEIYTRAITMGMDRKSPVIALGGGVVGDLAGFAASTYLRGVPFVQIPTTLLAQVDSSVGGKTAVNHPLGKNLIGSFYQPAIVIIDPETLNTLPERELSAGLAEVVKYGVFADEDFFEYLAGRTESILNKKMDVLMEIISRCCRIKADIVEQDERESGVRTLLNFGHTIGHAVEAAGGFSKYNHGEAVAIGMLGAVNVSCLLKLCGNKVMNRVETLLANLNLPLNAKDCAPAEELLGYLVRDKKSVGGKIKWVLLHDIGKPKITADVPEYIVKEAIFALIK